MYLHRDLDQRWTYMDNSPRFRSISPRIFGGRVDRTSPVLPLDGFLPQGMYAPIAGY